MLVRTATEADAAMLARLLRSINDEPGLKPGRITAARVLQDLVGDPRVTLLVAELDGGVRGFASAHPFYDSGVSLWGMVLNDLYVAPDARRRGLGRALVSGMAGEASRQGGHFLWWDADDGDALALSFHRGIGAREERTISFIMAGESFRGLCQAPQATAVIRPSSGQA